MALISSSVGYFDETGHVRKLNQDLDKPFFFLNDFRTGSARKRVPKSDENSIVRFFDEISNKWKTAAPRDLKPRFLAIKWHPRSL